MFVVDSVEARAGWSDLGLPASQMALLREIVGHGCPATEEGPQDRERSGGKGAIALFAGARGTGKALAAQVVAAERRQPLYRVDLAQVQSKYIGETEKNLNKLFDAAEAGNAVLFFDEADALFGKRSEVKDSHDRYANIDVSYLLQRMEAFDGLTVLATNRKADIDPEILRRLRFVVDFPRAPKG
jgi:SpoVK/Ycf46/Vps4 family AAA+-type ATPase